MDKIQTVGDLRRALADYSDDMKIRALWDSIPTFAIHGAHVYQDTIVLDVGASSRQGDWHWISDEMGDGYVFNFD